jgi:hypothetical protein
MNIADPIEIAPGAMTLGYTMGDTYSATLPNVGSGRLVRSFPGTVNTTAFDLVDSAGTKLPVYVTLLPSSWVGTVQWGATTPGGISGSAFFGVATPPGAIPTSGSVTYSTLTTGDGITLTVDFSARTASGTIALAWVDDWGPYKPTLYALTGGQLDPATGVVTASFTVPGVSTPGIVKARLMGDAATATCISYRGWVLNPYDEKFEPQASVATASRCAANCSP